MPSLLGIVIKTSVLAPVLHEVQGSCPGTVGVSQVELLRSTPTPFRGPGGKANFILCGFQKLRLPGFEPLPKNILFEHFYRPGNRTPDVLTETLALYQLSYEGFLVLVCENRTIIFIIEGLFSFR